MARILVIDDEFGVAEVLEAALTDAGHAVVTAPNGRVGLARLDESAADLVLLDYMMPVMDGPATLRAIRAHDRHRAVPVAMMSSLPERSVAATLEPGYQAFLRKPFKVREVLALVDRLAGVPR